MKFLDKFRDVPSFIKRLPPGAAREFARLPYPFKGLVELDGKMYQVTSLPNPGPQHVSILF